MRRLLSGEQARRGEPLEWTTAEDVGRDPLLRAMEQLAEVAPVAEDHVAQHEHRQRVAEHPDGGVDRASRPRRPMRTSGYPGQSPQSRLQGAITKSRSARMSRTRIHNL